MRCTKWYCLEPKRKRKHKCKRKCKRKRKRICTANPYSIILKPWPSDMRGPLLFPFVWFQSFKSMLSQVVRKRIPQTATPNGRRCSPRGETLRQHATRIQKETLPASIGLRCLPQLSIKYQENACNNAQAYMACLSQNIIWWEAVEVTTAGIKSELSSSLLDGSLHQQCHCTKLQPPRMQQRAGKVEEITTIY